MEMTVLLNLKIKMPNRKSRSEMGLSNHLQIEKLKEEYPDAFGFSVSHTTRQPRVERNEKDGVHYHFVSRDEMKRGIAAGEFIENAEFRSEFILSVFLCNVLQWLEGCIIPTKCLINISIFLVNYQLFP